MMVSRPPGIDHASRSTCHTSPSGEDCAFQPLGYAVIVDAKALGELLP